MNEALRYSEAIRLGALLKPQGFGIYRSDKTACVNDAALLAIGEADKATGIFERLDPDGADRILEERFPLSALPVNAQRRCPVCSFQPSRYSFTLGGTLAHLNDDHRWSRERIADFVATIEAQSEAANLSEPVAEAVSA